MATPGDRRSSGIVTPERWKQVEAVFEQALELPFSQRAAFFERSCNGDEELRREVESLLDSHANSGTFIDKRSLFFSKDSLDETGATVPAGELIGPYRVVREIGRGGMGAVYLAQRADEQFEQRVAIKVIKRGMDTESVLRHFRSERQILASFDHPNIARLFDGGTTREGLPYFVMEHVEGEPIDHYCAQHQLGIRARLKLFRQVCDAVSYAHQHAVIHRDIKPSNIIVTAARTPKLLDFGIAKVLQPNNAEPLVTATGLRPMTPEYASPEQVRGDRVTTASDVYSLGVVLYELLTGELPYKFQSQSSADVARAITDTDPKKPSTVTTFRNRESAIGNRKSLRGDLDNILLMALRKEPARRYQSVEQFSEDFCRHLEGRPVRARRDTFAYRASKFIRRNAVATAAAALLILSLVAGLAGTTWEARRARRQEQRAERRFNDVRQLAHSVLFDYHDAIKHLPGATAVRERLVKDALTYLDSLSSDASGDHALQRELAAAYERVGDVRGEIYSASLGDMAGALDSYEKALRIREALVAADPRDVNHRHDLAESYTKIGSQLQDTVNAARGLEYLRKACAAYQQLAIEHADHAEIIDWLSRVHNELGVALLRRGDPTGALDHHNEALRIRQELVTRDPQNEIYKRHLAITYWDIGQALLLRGDTNAALEANQKAMDLSAALLARNPTSTRDRRRLSIGYQTIGDCRALTGDVVGALEIFRRKLQVDEQSLAADPLDVQAQADVGFSCARIGELFAKQGDHAQALDYESRALGYYEKLAAESPQELDTVYRTSVIGSITAELHAKFGDQKSAVGAANKALTLLNTLPDDAPSSVYSAFRARVYWHLGGAHATLAASSSANTQREDLWRAARGFYQRSLSIWQDLQKRGRLTAEIASKPDETARELAKCDAALLATR